MMMVNEIMIKHNFSDIIKDFGSLDFFYPVFGLCNTRAKVGCKKQITFEIRTKEQGHNIPHIHAWYENENISISLVDYSVLAGNIPQKQVNIAVEWTKNNIDMLRMKWNEYHCYNIPVFGDKKPI